MQLAGDNFANANDQKLCADMYVNGKHGIHLDFHARLFQSVHMTLDPPLANCNPVDDLVLTNTGTWKNTRTGSLPALFHFNGGGKAYHLMMESKMWYRQQYLGANKSDSDWLNSQRLQVPSQEGNCVLISCLGRFTTLTCVASHRIIFVFEYISYIRSCFLTNIYYI